MAMQKRACENKALSKDFVMVVMNDHFKNLGENARYTITQDMNQLSGENATNTRTKNDCERIIEGYNAYGGLLEKIL